MKNAMCFIGLSTRQFTRSGGTAMCAVWESFEYMDTYVVNPLEKNTSNQYIACEMKRSWEFALPRCPNN